MAAQVYSLDKGLPELCGEDLGDGELQGWKGGGLSDRIRQKFLPFI